MGHPILSYQGDPGGKMLAVLTGSLVSLLALFCFVLSQHPGLAWRYRHPAAINRTGTHRMRKLRLRLMSSLETYFGIGWGNRLEEHMKKYIPVVLASGGDVGEGLDHILQTKILRKVRNRHDTQVEHFEKLKSSITETWGVYFPEMTPPERSIDLIEKELIRLGVDRG